MLWIPTFFMSFSLLYFSIESCRGKKDYWKCKQIYFSNNYPSHEPFLPHPKVSMWLRNNATYHGHFLNAVNWDQNFYWPHDLTRKTFNYLASPLKCTFEIDYIQTAQNHWSTNHLASQITSHHVIKISPFLTKMIPSNSPGTGGFPPAGHPALCPPLTGSCWWCPALPAGPCTPGDPGQTHACSPHVPAHWQWWGTHWGEREKGGERVCQNTLEHFIVET